MERAQIKAEAKAALRENFGSKMLLLIIPILWEILGVGNTVHTAVFGSNGYESNAIGGIVAFLGIFVGLVILVVSLFMAVITTGAVFNYIKIFRKERKNPAFANIFIPFQDGTWTKIIALNLVQALILIGLSVTVVGIIPAIYLGLGWSQATYVLFDQLEHGTYTGVWGCLRASSDLMRGLRANFFVFELSFIGWMILTGLTGGLLGFWTMPYISMAEVAYYENVVLA